MNLNVRDLGNYVSLLGLVLGKLTTAAQKVQFSKIAAIGFSFAARFGEASEEFQGVAQRVAVLHDEGWKTEDVDAYIDELDAADKALFDAHRDPITK